MPLESGEKLNRIDKIKDQLFSKNYKTEIEHRNTFTHLDRSDVPSNWPKEEIEQNVEKFFMKTSIFKKFFVFSVTFFLVALLYAGYSFLGGGNTVSNDNIDISIIGNTFTAGGEELSLQVEITNRNNSSLDLADLVVEYPKGSELEDMERFRVSLGTIPSGAVRNENLKLTLFGEQSSSRQIKVSLEYRVEGSNAIFVKEKLYDVSISSTPIDLSIDAPSQVSPNQSIVLNVKITLNSTKPASKMLLKLEYPPGFQFEKSSPSPSFGNNVWNLGDLAPGAERNISITGRMIDVFDGEEKTFHVSSGSQSASDKTRIGVVFNSLAHTMMVRRPFVDAELTINGASEREYAVGTKTLIYGEVRYRNNLETKINNLQIRVKLTGNALDQKSISVREGRYESINDLLVWDKSSRGALGEVNPGETGVASFSFSSLPLSGAFGILRDPMIRLEVSVSGEQALEGNEIKNIDSSDNKIIKIISDVGFTGKVLYSPPPFQNSGPIPPQAEKETTYSIVWTVTNTANTISKAKVSSTLPPWVRFIGSVSPASADVSYNAATKEVVWNIGTIGRGTGVTTSGKEVAFRVALLPSLSQVGTAPVLINDATLTGHDDFANVTVRVNKPSLDTSLFNDSLFPRGADKVIE